MLKWYNHINTYDFGNVCEQTPELDAKEEEWIENNDNYIKHN